MPRFLVLFDITIPHASCSQECLLTRLADESERAEHRPKCGPEVYTVAKPDGLLVESSGTSKAFSAGQPEHAPYAGMGGRLYPQTFVEMYKFVILCGKGRLPIIGFQDTSGIDVGDRAVEQEALGQGQSLIRSIEQASVPIMVPVLRQGTAAAHYSMGGPTANNHTAFALGTPATEVSVMQGKSATAASLARHPVKEKDWGRPLQPIIDKMNALVEQHFDRSGPIQCAKRGFVDEVVFRGHAHVHARVYRVCIPESGLPMSSSHDESKDDKRMMPLPLSG